ncbi:diaminopimelate decarboxylase [Methylacidimicrobium cyclopophantes]|uniref:Diaminopimelate decarboxylase n=1 Tax=Methylacidimicrobium cyclopophantes TaxID=1041766 RepID=A0A5E6MHZ6_9BACT|nr:diaminopimelate decarboxylase [Methylacidimicrobium cyclopophantes]VVM07529.1 diaminopimelate decarboxylase [Methylacidimicrobium cyclopophantes]
MHRFRYRGDALFVEEVEAARLAERYGTPLYVYSAGTIVDHYDRLVSSLRELHPLVCYAVKANSNLSVLRLLASRGCGFDLVSGGELYRVLRAGGDPALCTFAGVAKTSQEITEALEAGIYSFIVESREELAAIERVAARLGKRAPVALRVNPDVGAQTHAKVKTGIAESKFGIAAEEIEELYRQLALFPNLFLRGIQIHIGSQIRDVEPFEEAVRRVIPLVEIARDRFGAEFFDIGGGLGIAYEEALQSGDPGWWESKAQWATPARYAQRLRPLLEPLKLRIVVEPGRLLVGNAGILLTRVLYRKDRPQKKFVIVDAGMNDLIRPALYGSFHQIVPVARRAGESIEGDVVGPVCESGDCFASSRRLPWVEPGDLLAIFSAGAYGFSMASQYNSRPRPAEVLVEGTDHRLIRRRESYEDLVRGEQIGEDDRATDPERGAEG